MMCARHRENDMKSPFPARHEAISDKIVKDVAELRAQCECINELHQVLELIREASEETVTLTLDSKIDSFLFWKKEIRPTLRRNHGQISVEDALKAMHAHKTYLNKITMQVCFSAHDLDA